MIFNKEQSVGYWAKHITIGFKAELENRVDRFGLTAPECFLIIVVSEFGSRTLVEIARMLEHAHPSVIRHLDGLEKAGFLIRKPHEKDRRKKVIELTAKGLEIAPQIKTELMQISQKAVTGLGPDEIEQVLSSMKRITHNLGFSPNTLHHDLPGHCADNIGGD